MEDSINLWPSHLREWESRRAELREIAVEARLGGKHHSNFRVGAAALLYDIMNQCYSVVRGENYKPQKGTKGPRTCAEETPMAIAELRQCVIIGMIIAGDHQPDDQTGLNFKSLLPCVHCRAKFKVLKEDTALIDERAQFESLRISASGEIADSLPFTFESLYRLAPVDAEDVLKVRLLRRKLVGC